MSSLPSPSSARERSGEKSRQRSKIEKPFVRPRRIILRLTLAWPLTMVFLLAGCNMPLDPNGTLDRVVDDTMRVGFSEYPPWVVRTQGAQPAGVEAELVSRFAEKIGAEIEWEWGGIEDNLKKLEQFELDLVVGGLTEKTPWMTRIGLTKPYHVSYYRIGVPPDRSLTTSFDGIPVGYKKGELTGIYLQNKTDSKPLAVDNPQQFDGPIAAPDWQLEAWGFNPADIVIHKTGHVLAVPPGENEWLMALEQFLTSQKPTLSNLIQHHVEP